MAGEKKLSPFGNALAGAIGGVVSNAIVYPLDTVKTRIQASSSSSQAPRPSLSRPTPTSRRPSASSISRPNHPSISLNPDGSLDRRSGSLLKRLLYQSITKAETAAEAVEGEVGEVGGEATGVMKLIAQIWRENGIEGFYRGFGANMLNTFSMQFAYFYWYSIVRTTYITRFQKNTKGISTAMELLLGAIAGMIAQIFTIPVSVIATRQQLSSAQVAPSLLTTLRQILAEDGITGLWRGLKPSLILTVNPAITYGVFERLKSVIGTGAGGKMGPSRSFLVGAGSKTLATVVTYPYIMAKVRLQAKYEDSTPPPSSLSSPQRLTEVGNGGALEASKEISEGAANGERDDDEERTKIEVYESVERKRRASRERYKGAIDVLVKVWKEKGFFGWYQGMQAQITKAVLSQALLFGIKDYLDGYTLLFLAAAEVARQKATAKALKVS